jgi:hypothetical protein
MELSAVSMSVQEEEKAALGVQVAKLRSRVEELDAVLRTMEDEREGITKALESVPGAEGSPGVPEVGLAGGDAAWNVQIVERDEEGEPSVGSASARATDVGLLQTPLPAVEAREVSDTATTMVHSLPGVLEHQPVAVAQKGVDLVTQVLSLQKHVADISRYCRQLETELAAANSSLQASEAAAAEEAKLTAKKEEKLREANSELGALHAVRVRPVYGLPSCSINHSILPPMQALRYF